MHIYIIMCYAINEGHLRSGWLSVSVFNTLILYWVTTLAILFKLKHPRKAEADFHLQEGHSVNVNLLLFCNVCIHQISPHTL